MKAGAAEFLTKPYHPDEVVAAVRQALARSAQAHEAGEKDAAMRQAYESLTPRERDVMRLVVTGLLNKQVGGELGISEITVKTHRGNVMRKMRAQSLAALVVMASHLGLPTGTRR
jgi:FixJ family two-component response regulator